MGLVSSRLNLEGLHSGRQRSQQDATLYSYSLNKSFFSNYFLMGGERFESKDPDYLFGDNCDLNFLSCTKPHTIPYKQAQQNLLSNLNSKQRSNNKASSRVNTLSSPFNILTRRHRQASNSRKQDAQTQTLTSSKGSRNGSEPSQPLIMFINIRKETLRLVKSSVVYGFDTSDAHSLTNSTPAPVNEQRIGDASAGTTRLDGSTREAADSKDLSRTMASKTQHQRPVSSSSATSQQTIPNRLSTASSRATTSTIHANEAVVASECNLAVSGSIPERLEPDVGSLLSATSSIKSGYASVKGDDSGSMNRYNNEDNDDDEDDDDEFKDALNDTTNLSVRQDDEDDQYDNDISSEKTQQESSLLSGGTTKENRDTKITIEPLDNACASNSSDTKSSSNFKYQQPKPADGCEADENSVTYSTPRGKRTSTMSSVCSSASSVQQTKTSVPAQTTQLPDTTGNRRAYNIEFTFDTEVDCLIRIYYFCTRELSSSGITYKSQHATYKSKNYYYGKGLNQKFDQSEHTFQPFMFDEDLLIYKPLDDEGNYNSGAVFPIVIHCVALEGSMPRQSHSLVVTIEKSQLDEGYSIKPLKQLIFVDGVQYILQDIYGIEHKQLTGAPTEGSRRALRSSQAARDRASLRSKSQSLQSHLNESQLNLSDSVSVTSLASTISGRSNHHRRHGSLASQHHKSLAGENSFECVICMSEERDTMLLPCRHLCLCSSCAQSLRYQATSCPICRCPFKAALNLRPIRRHSRPASSTMSASAQTVVDSSKQQASTTATATATTTTPSASASKSVQRRASRESATADTKDIRMDPKGERLHRSTAVESSRRESLTTPATPLLSPAPTSNSGTAEESLVGASEGSLASQRRPADVVAAPSSSKNSKRAADQQTAPKRQSDPHTSRCGSLELQSMNIQWGNKSSSP